MSAATLTILIAIGTTLATALIFPLYIQNRAEKHAAEKELEENSDLSWVNINRAIVVERDALQKKLDIQNTAHVEELAHIRERHRSEIDALKTKYDADMNGLKSRLTECQEKVSALYQELYELQKLLPPDLRLQ